MIFGKVCEWEKCVCNLPTQKTAYVVPVSLPFLFDTG